MSWGGEAPANPLDPAPVATPTIRGPSPAGAHSLRAAAVWLVVVAVIATAAIVFLLLVFGGFAAGAMADRLAEAVTLLLVLVWATAAAAVVAWRAAMPGHGPEGLIAFVLGAGTLIAVLGPAIALLFPLGGHITGLDADALASAARLPLSLAVLVPGTLMVIGTVGRWCATGGAARGRRTWLAWAGAVALVVAVIGMAAVQATGQACSPGQTCVTAAGISFVLPDGWRRVGAEGDDVFAASAGSERTRFVIEDGGKVFRDQARAIPANLDGVETAVTSLLRGGGGFGGNSDISARRVDLPIGPAVRVAYTSATSFIFTYYQTNITEWFFVDGRLVLLHHMTSYGEGTPGDTSSDPADFARLLASLRAL